MGILKFHRTVAQIALRAAAPAGFALGGGNALMAHGVVDRMTEDVDLFTDREDGVAEAADAVQAALLASGLTADRQDKTAGLADIFEGMGDQMAEWDVASPAGEATKLQMAFIERRHDPVVMDIGPVLDLKDVVGSKICALASRVMTRDYVDAAAAMRRFSIGELIELARGLDAGLTGRDFADAGLRLDGMEDARFARYGLTPADVAEIRRQFADWPRR